MREHYKGIIFSIVVLGIGLIIFFGRSGAPISAPVPTDNSLPVVYTNKSAHFSIRIPANSILDEHHRYQELGPDKEISGIKFTMPPSMATGTNLSADTYLSVEQIPLATSTQCAATLFLDKVKSQMITDGNVTYSFGASMGAAAGNRYEEAVFAIPGTSPCIAIRYYIHYGVFENYPAGSVNQFDEQALIAMFDAMRHTFTPVP